MAITNGLLAANPQITPIIIKIVRIVQTSAGDIFSSSFGQSDEE